MPISLGFVQIVLLALCASQVSYSMHVPLPEPSESLTITGTKTNFSPKYSNPTTDIVGKADLRSSDVDETVSKDHSLKPIEDHIPMDASYYHAHDIVQDESKHETGFPVSKLSRSIFNKQGMHFFNLESIKEKMVNTPSDPE